MAACVAVQKDAPTLALALVLWAHVADSLDGLLARNQPNRSPETQAIGKAMDALSDFLYSGAFPLILIVNVAGNSWLAVASGMLLCSAGILRLSYFEAHGLINGRFTGLPLPHNVFVIAAIYPLLQLLPTHAFNAALCLVYVTLSILNVSSIRIPKMGVRSVIASVILAVFFNFILLSSSG